MNAQELNDAWLSIIDFRQQSPYVGDLLVTLRRGKAEGVHEPGTPNNRAI